MKSLNLYLTQIFFTLVIISFIFVGFPRTTSSQSFNSISDLHRFPSLSQGALGGAVSDYYSMSSLSKPIYAPQAFSMSSMHNFPTLSKDEQENQWFHDWVDAFGSVPITSYPAVRVGRNQIDVWMIPHEWDIATKGWDDYERLIWEPNLVGWEPTPSPLKAIPGLAPEPDIPCDPGPCIPVVTPKDVFLKNTQTNSSELWYDSIQIPW